MILLVLKAQINHFEHLDKDLRTEMASLNKELREEMILLRRDMDKRFEQVDRRFEQVEPLAKLPTGKRGKLHMTFR
jgi:hypothetical protein